MRKNWKLFIILLASVLLLAGCAMPTVDELYCLPKRAYADSNLQEVIDEAMTGLQYSAPISGENQQTIQMADLDGDGMEEYLLFAQASDEKSLKILIFSQVAAGYTLMDTIDGYGFAFEFVTYANVDDRPGLEIIVGRQVSDQMVRAVSVYRFSSGFARQMLTASYAKLLTEDFDLDGLENLLLITPGQAEDVPASAVLYGFRDGKMERSAEMALSSPVDGLKRVNLGNLEDGTPSVFFTSVRNEEGLACDVLFASEGQLCSAAMNVPIAILDNYYIYPEDMDGDGVTDLPALEEISQNEGDVRYLLRWFSLTLDGQQTDKIYTYHNLHDGWYLRLDASRVENLQIRQTEDQYHFTMVQEDGEPMEILTIQVLSGPDREEQAKQEEYILLHRGDTEIYIALLADQGEEPWITEAELKENFRPIRVDWMAETNKGENNEESTDP